MVQRSKSRSFKASKTSSEKLAQVRGGAGGDNGGVPATDTPGYQDHPVATKKKGPTNG